MNFEEKKCIIRSDRAGVFLADVKKIEGSTVEVENSRRLWYWEGAASISQLANEGVSNPTGCKFPAPVASQIILGVIEIIPATEMAIKSISEVIEWKM